MYRFQHMIIKMIELFQSAQSAITAFTKKTTSKKYYANKTKSIQLSHPIISQENIAPTVSVSSTANINILTIKWALRSTGNNATTF